MGLWLMLMLASLGCLSLLTLRRRGKAANLLLRSRQAIPSEKTPMPESFSRHGRFAAGACSFPHSGRARAADAQAGGRSPLFHTTFFIQRSMAFHAFQSRSVAWRHARARTNRPQTGHTPRQLTDAAGDGVSLLLRPSARWRATRRRLRRRVPARDRQPRYCRRRI